MLTEYLEAMKNSSSSKILWLEFELFDPRKILEESDRIMVFTPTDDVTMQYRLVQVSLAKTVSDATHWAFLTPPTNSR